MPFKLYDSLTNLKKEFKPLSFGKVSIYVCGITPYDTTHLGHTFTYVFFDTLVRYLKFKGYKVTYTQNVTDIDDDILKKAKELKTDWKKLGEKWTTRYLEDMKALNILPPTHYIKATEAIPEIIEIIRVLIQKGFASEINGNVYFEVSKFKNYGKLSKLTREEMIKISAERGANPNDPNKIDPLDFLLWQKSLEDEPFWNSPWGKGRPGWHIECSAMIYKTLGPQIDLHGGGYDLIYPHHESEIAQSESFTNKLPFVKYWSHVAMLNYKGEKMYKSLGNLVMVRDLLKKYSPNAIRWILLSHHYRSEWDFEEGELQKAERVLNKITQNLSGQFPTEEFTTLMDNDLDTPSVLKLLEKTPSKKLLQILGFTI